MLPFLSMLRLLLYKLINVQHPQDYCRLIKMMKLMMKKNMVVTIVLHGIG